LRTQTIQRIQDVLDYVNSHVEENGYPPSVREICAALGLKSTSTVHIYLKRLEAEGRIQRSPSKPRALKVIHTDGARKKSASPAKLGAGRPSAFESADEAVYVPVVGKVTAGAPILAIENIEYSFPVPAFFVNGSDTFMLRVEGDSMVDAGIRDRDFILVRQQPDAVNGDIVVAMVGDEATVKAYYREKRYVRLQPRNDNYEPIYVRGDCKVVGKVVGVFRKL
jgi:repressor LexA